MLQCNEYLITANNIEQFKTPFTWDPDKVLNGQELARIRGKRRKTSILKGQCPDYAHARASSVFSSKDNRTVILTRQDFLPGPHRRQRFVVYILK